MTLETPVPWSATFYRLHDIMPSLERQYRSRNRLAVYLMKECMFDGFATRAEIVAILHELGFRRAHVHKVLDEGTGPYSDLHHWQLHSGGRYIPHADNYLTTRM